MKKLFDLKFWLAWVMLFFFLVIFNKLGKVIDEPNLKSLLLLSLTILGFLLINWYLTHRLIKANEEESESPPEILKKLKAALRRGTDLDPDPNSAATDAEIILILSQLNDLKEDKVELAEQAYNEAKALVKQFRPWCKMKI